MKKRRSEKNIYIGDIHHHHDAIPRPEWKNEILVNQLSQRMDYIERALACPTIVKATPLTSLIYMDANCQRRVNVIYDNWIGYMKFIARDFLTGLTVEQCFWVLDRFVFDGYFSKLGLNVYFIDVMLDHPYSDQQREILTRILERDRDANHQLKIPSDREFISYFVSGKDVFLTYYPLELAKEIQNSPTSRPQDRRKNVQIRVDPSLSLNKSVVDELDSKAIGVSSSSSSASSSHLQLNKSQLDKRLIVLGSQRTLYNTVIDVKSVDELQTNLHGMGTAALNHSLIVYHAMLHVKCLLTAGGGGGGGGGHSNVFVDEFINNTPSVLYGHHTFPAMTIDDSTIPIG